MRATYYLTAAIAATRAALAAPVEHAHAAAAAHTNLVTDEAATNATSLATAIDRRDVDMGINAENKIGKFLTPLAKHIKWYGGPKKESNACYNYYVNGEEPDHGHTFRDWKYQDCVLVKHALPTRHKALHLGQFWYDHNMAKYCYNDLQRMPCVVDLRYDTGCHWDHVKYQKRCKHFPNWGLHEGPDPINATDLSWVIPDAGESWVPDEDCEKQNLEDYFRHGKQSRHCVVKGKRPMIAAID